ncbi:MAG: hypothetical protein ACI9QC_000659 [Oceanicoccus sp.]|jgi:hypothetical protein
MPNSSSRMQTDSLSGPEILDKRQIVLSHDEAQRVDQLPRDTSEYIQKIAAACLAALVDGAL